MKITRGRNSWRSVLRPNIDQDLHGGNRLVGVTVVLFLCLVATIGMRSGREWPLPEKKFHFLSENGIL